MGLVVPLCSVVRVNSVCESWPSAWLLGNGSFILIRVSLDLEDKYLGESFSLPV